MNIKYKLREGLQNIREDYDVEKRNLNRKEFSQIYKNNLETVNNIIFSYPQIWLDELGLETILDFLSVEDGMNFRLQHGITQGNPARFDKKVERGENESDIDFILRSNEVPYSWDEIKLRLVRYFCQGVVRNVQPSDDFNTLDDILKFLNIYKEAFMYGYMLPMIKIHKK
jgi:hypothetical protein